MEVILRTDVEKLGKASDVIKVKDGFARNYLLPKGLALKATKYNIEQIEKEKKARSAQEEKERQSSQDLANKLNGKSFTIPVSTNELDALYASVTKKDILEAVKLEGFNLDQENILLPASLKELGIYEIDVRLKFNITSKIKIWVVKK
jgi:large subunit ribosomal protein L9